ncbi:N,N-dimethylformamidase beta subunit family domain-containing protein [Nakamurella lactea]|uniref:N,N-dimethylformamidase beta subunit family domain-containing protein n=1 Tax=Nakamurella lactea TaxID=459515 RepID=UPI0004007A9D|nr:N,N-dimethylformamidase beta subunit family domain-containing protein [Nakamurella lactea]
MPTHSIFGASPPPGTQVAADDGQPIWVGNTFYTYGSGAAGWRCYGGRLYIAPGNVASMPATVTAAVWNNTTRTANNLDATPLDTKTVTIPAGGGWVEWTWTTPITITAGQVVMIGYTGGTKYLSSPSPTNSFIPASDSSTLVMTDGVNAGPGLDRTYYRYGTSAIVWLTDTSASLWGVDILVDEGSGPAPTTGSASGSIGWVGTATGTAITSAGGAASGSITWAGTATGYKMPQGAASGSVSWVGRATGPNSGRTIAQENELTGAPSSEWEITGAGDYDNVGFPRQFSSNVGETVEFSCTTDGGGVVLDIYRIGYYGGDGWHKVTSLVNTAITQPTPTTIPSSNGGISCSNWSVTASWDIPSDATTGLYVGVYRNAAGNDASYIPFVVRDDARQADIIIKTSETTWALAYNYYGGPAAPLAGKSLYGSGGPLGDITTRAQAVSYDRPVVTRQGVTQTYWLACEAPMIRWAERMGYNVKYVASRDLDDDPSRIAGAKILVSSGHDEYWTTGMRDTVEAFRNSGGHVLFQSGNEVFWRTRLDSTDPNVMWCFKDTQDGPGGHDGGTAIDPVFWTGSWSDTRWVGRKPTNTLNGTYFRMNGVNDKTATFDHTAAYASHPMWRNTVLASGSSFSVAGIIGFEADEYDPPAGINPVRLGQTIVTGTNIRADDNGEFYTLPGNIDWGICSQRRSSGAVVIGFGTCQWSWGLDATHDRGSNVANLNIQQAEYNILRDLGANPATPHSGIVTSSPAALTAYGTAPTAVPQWSLWNGSAEVPLTLAGVWDGSTIVEATATEITT